MMEPAYPFYQIRSELHFCSVLPCLFIKGTELQFFIDVLDCIFALVFQKPQQLVYTGNRTRRVTEDWSSELSANTTNVPSRIFI
jgi:hypothetical protein